MNQWSLILALFSAISCVMQAQTPAFYHLSTAEGLSDNSVNWVARDKNGVLWIGTNEGLNNFDGNRISAFYKQQHPELGNNGIDKIVIDSDNKVWIRTISPFVTMLDDKRKFQKYAVGDTTDGFNVTALFSTSRGVFAVKNRKHYLIRKDKPSSFEKIDTPFDSLFGSPGFNQYLENDRVIYYRKGILYLADYDSMKLILSIPLAGLNGACDAGNDKLIAFNAEKNIFYHISISKARILNQYNKIRDQFGLPIAGMLRNIVKLDENRFAFTNYFAGLYIIDFSILRAYHYDHDPVDPKTIGGRNTYNIIFDTTGYLFITTLTSGLHFFNIHQKYASSKTYFIDNNKEIFDGFIHSVTTDARGNVWMGTQDRLIKWKRQTDKTEYVPLRLADKSLITGGETIREVHADTDGKIWVGTSRHGVLVLDNSLQTLKQLTDSLNGKRTNFPSQWINAICTDKQGNKWIGTLSGTCIIDKNNYSVISISKDSLLAEMSKIPCSALWAEDNGRIWIGTTRGAWCYDASRSTIKQYSKKEGLVHNTVYAISKDLLGNIYFATLGGLSILDSSGAITNYTRANGLRNDRCEGLLRDKNGFIWIGNLNCIVRFDPLNKKFAVFEEGYGFSHGGFRMRCAHADGGGEMFWGTDKGLVYFNPEHMSGSPLPLRPVIHSLQTSNNNYYFTKKEKINFPFITTSFVFSFSSGELTGDKKNQLLCRLKGFDDDWKVPAVTGQAVYSKLPPGNYTFEIKASRDGTNWYSSSYPVDIIIAKPWWQQTWFRILCAAVIAGISVIIYLYVQKRRKNKMEVLALNVKMAESKFSNLRLQMNPHFLFNSLSSIQHLIVSQQTTRAYKYLTVFSNFLRSLLNYAEKNFIPLDEELKILQMYVELESLRFDQSFTWEIKTDEHLANDEVFVPTLMIQPFVENAIWHGLLHKEGDKKLLIHFQNSTEEYLTCTVEDNGVGREESTRIRQSKISSMVHESKGISIIKERLKLLEQKTGKPARLEVKDIYNNAHEATGTKVIITIPYYNPEET